MVMKRVPSFSSRPGFPNGLKVLLVEPDSKHREHVSSLLLQCSYQVSSCANMQELLLMLQSHESYDVLLGELKTLSDKSAHASLHDSIKAAPLVLMSDNPSTDDIMCGVKLGAVEVLEKPLSQTKLRTLWQHTVRKMMSSLTFLPSPNIESIMMVVPELEEPATPSPAPSGISNNSSGRRDTELETEHSSLSQAAEQSYGCKPPTSLVRTCSITSSRSSSPEERKRKSLDGLENPRSKACKDATAPPCPQQQQQAPLPSATDCKQQQGASMPMPMLPQLPGMMPMLPNGFRPPMPGPLPAGMVWGLPMPPPGLMFPPGFIPPPFPAGFPIPPTILQSCFPPMCGPGAIPAPTSTAPMPPSSVPNMLHAMPPFPMPNLQSMLPVAPPVPPVPAPTAPAPCHSDSPTSTSLPQALLDHHDPHPPTALHPSPSLVSLDVAESEDMDMGMDKHSLGTVPVEMTGDSLADLPHLDGVSDTPALLFSDWLLEDGDEDARDGGLLLGLQLKKSDSLVDLINDSLCSHCTAVM